MGTSKQLQTKKIFLIAGAGLVAAAIIISIILISDESIPEPINENPVESTTQERFEIVEPDFENSENLKMLPQKNLNKDTASNHVLGFPVDGFIASLQASDSQEKFSIRFTSKFSGSISDVLLPMKKPDDEEVKVGIQESVNGHPSGVWLGSSIAYTDSKIIPSADVLRINFTQNIPIESGEIYHIVIEPTTAKDDGTTWLRVYNKNWSFNSLNHTNPDETWADPSINTLVFDGQSWKTTNYWPIYVINYSNGISDGQPYTLFAQWVIEEERYVGQAVIPYSNYNVDEISFVVAAKGNSSDDLYYAIYDSENNILRDGIFAKKGEMSAHPHWQSVSISSPIKFESGKLYRVVLYSPNSTLDDGYYVYGHEFMLDKTLGYGSTIHHLTASFNDLKSWIEWYDADAAFKFTGSN